MGGACSDDRSSLRRPAPGRGGSQKTPRWRATYIPQSRTPNGVCLVALASVASDGEEDRQDHDEEHDEAEDFHQQTLEIRRRQRTNTILVDCRGTSNKLANWAES